MSKKTFFYRYPFVYIVTGLLWIILTDYYLHLSNMSLKMTLLFGGLEGMAFIAFTMFYFVQYIKQLNEILEEKEKLKLLINTMPDFVSFKDGEGKWLQINTFGQKLFELEGVDYYGKNDAEVAKYTDFYHDALVYCIDTDEEAWRMNETSRCEEIIPLRDGTFKTFDTFKVPIFNKDGSRKALLVIGRDITDLKTTEKLLRQSEKLAVVGELAAGIAHEIRNPITTIKGFMQMAKENIITIDDHLDVMLEEIERINGIVNELLMVAKPQDAVLAEKNINQAVQEVVQLLSTEATLKNTNIEIIEDKSFNVYCYGNELKQVFINVIKNSLDAIQETGNITVSIFEKNADYFGVKIVDNGCGIEEERLKRIGEPFYSVKEKGIGLGMTVSYRIINSHKGFIDIKSQVNAGTSVEIILPKALSQAKAV